MILSDIFKQILNNLIKVDFEMDINFPTKIQYINTDWRLPRLVASQFANPNLSR